jgi:hypothetical protein
MVEGQVQRVPEWDGEGWEVRSTVKQMLEPVTVGNLMEWLGDLPPDTTVVVSRDAEGNEFKPLMQVTKHRATVSTSAGYGGVDLHDDGAWKVVVLWPFD